MSASKARILLVDDDPQALESTRKILELSGFEVVPAADGKAALDTVRSENASQNGIELIVTDVRMPKLGGLEFLRALSLCGNTTPVILMTAYGRIEDAVWAMKLGAVDFLTKPFKRQALISSVEAALKRARGARGAFRGISGETTIVGKAPAILELHALIQQVAPTAATVLIQGESGTGKELVARCIHERSARARGRFIAINCAAVPEQLIESELFGFEKGAFTGATSAKEGLFEAAHEGTLFLDEIGDMPVQLQAKLLRVLQESEVRRIGATASRKVNVRLVAATHRDLRAAQVSGGFREDLLYRLEVITLAVPPLRARVEDIPELAYHFLRVSNERHGKQVQGIVDEAMEALLAHPWPGNVRELSNAIERAVVFAQSPLLTLDSLPPHLSGPESNEPGKRLPQMQSISVPFGTALKDVEDLVIRKTLEATSGDKNMTAKLLGINSRTIYRKLKDSPEAE